MRMKISNQIPVLSKVGDDMYMCMIKGKTTKVCLLKDTWTPYGTYSGRREYVLDEDEVDWFRYWVGKPNES